MTPIFVQHIITNEATNCSDTCLRGEELWVAALDVEKAFDEVHHTALFHALLTTGIDAHAGAALWRLYCEMSGYVSLWPGAESRTFEIQRGVRQGDPLSPLLFNLVLDGALQEVSKIWRRRGYGTDVGMDARGCRLTHVAFADDQTLIASSWLSMRRMLFSLRETLSRRGLSLHPAKCKVQTNREDWIVRGEAKIEAGFNIHVLPPGEPLRLLGAHLSLQDATVCELQYRISSGWRMRRLLLNNKITVKRRLKLFDSTVSSCILWCTVSWTPRVDELKQLEVTQRAMLRKTAGGARRPEEEWLEWIRRVIKKARQLASEVEARSWASAHSKRKWMWSGHVARRHCYELT